MNGSQKPAASGIREPSAGPITLSRDHHAARDQDAEAERFANAHVRAASGAVRKAPAQNQDALTANYDPDRVSHIAAEFRVLAEEWMKEINDAYVRLKAHRGWGSDSPS